MIQTRHNEVKFVTSDTAKMVGMYTAERIIKSWEEEVEDKKTGETLKILRNDLLLDSGIKITNDLAETIRFWIEEGSIKEVTVSNQRRMADAGEHYYFFPYKAVARIGDKRHSFILHALSVANALEILNDYIELNYFGNFYITDIKELDYSVILVDSLDTVTKNTATLNADYRKNDEVELPEIPFEEEDEDAEIDVFDEDEPEDKDEPLKVKFYKILARINTKESDNEENETTSTFIVRTFTATRASMIINKYLTDKEDERIAENPDAERMNIVASIEECKIINIGGYIPYQFSMAYKTPDNELSETDDTGAASE